jgi:hypothetical protein
MAKNLSITSSTDSPLDQRLADLQPYVTLSVTVATARPSVQSDDGSTEYAGEDVQHLEGLMPGKELRASMLQYSKRVDEFKKQNPDLDFDALVDQDIPISLALRDEVMRLSNGPDVATFLGFATDVLEQINKMAPLDQVKCVQAISEDLERAELPGDDADQATWKAARNLQVRQSARNTKNSSAVPKAQKSPRAKR